MLPRARLRSAVWVLAALYSATSDAESGALTYLFSGAAPSRVPFYPFADQAQSCAAALDWLTANDPGPHQLLTRILPLIEKRRLALEHLISVYYREGIAASRVAIASDAGGQPMGVIRDSPNRCRARSRARSRRGRANPRATAEMALYAELRVRPEAVGSGSSQADATCAARLVCSMRAINWWAQLFTARSRSM